MDMEGRLDNMDAIPAAASSRRRSSFIDMVLGASKHGGTRTDNELHPAREMSALPEQRSSPTAPCSAPGTGEARARKMSASRQAPHATDVLAARESDAVDADDSVNDNSAVEAGSDDVSDELAALRELTSTQRDDLNTAALIGQRLVDANDELSTQLEALREEKWQRDCENEALRRDLEHATQRCEQIQQDTAIDTVPEETQAEEFDLLSPATGPGNAARTSVSEDGWLGSAAAFFTGDAGADGQDQQQQRQQQQQEEEIGRLKKEVEKLEQANTALTERLVEARLEAAALRRTSVEHGEAMLDWTTRGRRCSSWSTPEDGGKMGPWPKKVDGAGIGQDDPKEARNQRLDSVFGGTDSQGKAQENRETYDGDSSLPREDKVRVDQTPAALAPVDNQGETTRSHGGKRKILTPAAAAAATEVAAAVITAVTTAAAAATAVAAAATPVSSYRRLSSSASEDAEEQAELVEGLRGQIAQLRLEVQTARKAARSSSATGQHAEGGQTRRQSKCSSDDNSEESGGDDGERGTDRDHGTGEGVPRSSRPRQQRFEEGAFGKGGGDGARTQSGGKNLDGGTAAGVSAELEKTR